MPLSRSTSATPEISASVFLALRRIRTPSSVRSGTMSAKELRVLDLPGHHRLGDAGLLQQADAGAQLAERDPVQVRRRRARRDVGELGKGLFLDGDDGDVVPGAARGVEDEEGETGRCRRSGRALHSSARTSSARRVARRKDHAALRGADEVDQVLHFGAGERPILLDLLQRARRVQLRLEQIPERPLQLLDRRRAGNRGASGRSCSCRKSAPGRLPTVRAYGSASLVTTE